MRRGRSTATGALGAVVAVIILSSALTEDRRLELLVIDVLGGWVFVVAGAVADARQPRSRAGALMVAVGLAWLLAGLRWADNSSLVQTTGLFFAWLWAAVLAQLALAFPSGRLENRSGRALVVAAYVIAVPVRLTWMVLSDERVVFANEPLLHPDGCARCPTPLLSSGLAPDVAAVLKWADQAAAALVAVGVCAALVRKWRQGSAVERRALAPVLVASGATAIVLAASTGASAAGLSGLGRLLEWLWDVCVVLLPCAFLVGVLRTRLREAAGLTRLVTELGELPHESRLDDALARALGDASLRVVFWLPASGGYVDGEGRAVEPPEPTSGRVLTPVALDGRRVAGLIHDAALVEQQEVVDAVGRAAALWLERARLEAERNARIVELRESRARLVAAGDAERRRVERDLHDGAQSRLAGLLLQSKLRRRAHDGHGSQDALIDDLERGLAAALADLRALAAGILPPVLSDHGLPAAVEELAARAPLPVAVQADGVGRLPDAVEAAAYFVVAEALANVIKHAHAEHAQVRIAHAGQTVTVEVDDDGVGGASLSAGDGVRGLADRVGALEGVLSLTSPADGGTSLRAELPCGS